VLALLQVGWFTGLNWKPGWQSGLVVASFALAWGLAWLTTQKKATGALRWDGRHWQWSGFADSACSLNRHLDFQNLMLASLHRPAGRPVWLWLQRSHDPQNWSALRRAVVYSTAHGQGHRARQAASGSPVGTP
jgi:hypothetical protein